MNSLHCFLHWLFPSGAAVAEWVAAAATACLVGAGFIQLKAIRKGAEEQRERWKRDDKILAEQNEPKAVFDFPDQVRGEDGSCLELTCTNLGHVNFLVAGMQIIPLQGEPIKVSFSPEEYFVVRVGEKKQVDLCNFGSLRNFSLCNYFVGIKLVLQGSSGEIETKSQACRIHFTSIAKFIAKGWKRSDGSEGLETIKCPKCNINVATFRLDDMTSVEDCRKEVAAVARDFERSCPNHASSNSRVTTVT